MTMFSRFIVFLKYKKKLVVNIQDRTVLTFDMDEIILNRNLTMGQKHERYETSNVLQGVARWAGWNFSKVTIIILACKY